MKRKIIHVDMDAFFAAIEQRDNPKLQGKPVVVGGNPEGRGVVSTASYEARAFGIGSGMSQKEAKRRCPEAIFLPVDMVKYKKVSEDIRTVFYSYTPVIEPISMDEAFLDVTGSQGLFGDAVTIGLKIKSRIWNELELKASCGIAHNKFLAKLGSDLEKPDGFVVIDKDNAKEFIAPLPVTKLWGVGKKTKEKLFKMGVKTIGDVASMPVDFLESKFGRQGKGIYKLAHAVDTRQVETGAEPKSIGKEITFEIDIKEKEKLRCAAADLCEQVGRRLRKQNYRSRVVVLKIRYENFHTITRRKTLKRAINISSKIFDVICELMDEVKVGTRFVRLIGVYVTGLEEADCPRQVSFFEDEAPEDERLQKVIDNIQDRFGESILKPGRSFKR